jgi:hypothetical protein
MTFFTTRGLQHFSLTAVFLFFFSIIGAEAELFPIGPFSGSVRESFESFPAGFTNSPVNIMGGAASVQTTGFPSINQTNNYAFSLGSSSANAPGDAAVPVDGLNLLGIESSLPPCSIDIVFTNATQAFGGYWGATADPGSPALITFAFFDAANQQVGTTQSVSYLRLSGDGMLEWHGWFSTTAFKKVTITSAGSTLVADSLHAGVSGFSVITSISPLAQGEYLLQGDGTPDVVFNVEANTNLATTNWTLVGTAPADATGALRFTNSSVFPQRFFRLHSP